MLPVDVDESFDTNIENEISRGNVCTQENVFCQNVMG